MPFPRLRLGGGGSESKSEHNGTASTGVDAGAEIRDGNLEYVVEQAGNDSPPSYQEAAGAPVETKSPFAYSVGAVTIIFLNLSKMVGTGVYSTRKSCVRVEQGALIGNDRLSFHSLSCLKL